MAPCPCKKIIHCLVKAENHQQESIMPFTRIPFLTLRLVQIDHRFQNPFSYYNQCSPWNILSLLLHAANFWLLEYMVVSQLHFICRRLIIIILAAYLGFVCFSAPLKHMSSWCFDEKLFLESLYKVMSSWISCLKIKFLFIHVLCCPNDIYSQCR